MNYGIIAVILLLLATSRKSPTSAKVYGSGTITYDGYWRRYSKWNTSTDYDYVCIIRGQDLNGKTIKRHKSWQWLHKENTWRKGPLLQIWQIKERLEFSKDPQLAFNDAWSNYLSQGGQPALNWTVKETPTFVNYANKERQRGQWLSALQFFFQI